MQIENLRLTFFKNHNGAIVGDLYFEQKRLLATAHPATIAAALYAMKATRLTVETKKGWCQVDFPILDADLITLGYVVPEELAFFMSGFATFSRFDLLNPMPGDDQAEIHLRTAIHHLLRDYVLRKPEAPAPKTWKRTMYLYSAAPIEDRGLSAAAHSVFLRS